MEDMETFLIVDNQVTCKFCQGNCNKSVKKSKNKYWWDCNTCNVSYLLDQKYSINPVDPRLSILQFKSQLENNKFYTIHLLFKSKQSCVYSWVKIANALEEKSPVPFYKTELVTELDYLLDLTPENFHNKLRTILTFL